MNYETIIIKPSNDHFSISDSNFILRDNLIEDIFNAELYSIKMDIFPVRGVFC